MYMWFCLVLVCCECTCKVQFLYIAGLNIYNWCFTILGYVRLENACPAFQNCPNYQFLKTILETGLCSSPKCKFEFYPILQCEGHVELQKPGPKKYR